MDARQVAGWLLVAGATLFFIGAANPVLMRAWTSPRDAFLGTIAAHPRAWRSTTLLMVAGTIVTPAALSIVWLAPSPGWTVALAQAGAVGYLIASALWLVTLLHRLAITPETARTFLATGSTEPWVDATERLMHTFFLVFIAAGSLALAAVGLATTGGGPIPAFVGWGTIALSAVSLVALWRTGDVPPFVLYLPPMAMGVSLLLAG